MTRDADFAATAPWAGITGRPTVFPSAPSTMAPDGATDGDIMVFSAALNRWVPLSLADLKRRLAALP